MNTKLLPCPHCGNPAELDTARAYRAMADGRIGDAVAIYCTRCSADMTFCYADAPGTPREDMVNHMVDEWNRRTSPAPTMVGVEELKWRKHPNRKDQYADTPFARYEVGVVNGGYLANVRRIEDGQWHDDVIAQGLRAQSDAKAAAQADYDRRIRSALVDVPAPAVEDWRDDHVQRFVEALCAEDIGDPIRASGPRLEALARSVLQYTFRSAASPPPQVGGEVERLREALGEAEETLRLCERPSFPDPAHHTEVKALGRRIGFGALMTTASAGWREVLAEDDYPVGGEFVAGPCHSTVVRVLEIIRAAIRDGGE